MGTSSGAMVLDTVDRLASDSVWDRTRRLLIPAPGVGRPGPVKKKISQSSTSSDSPIVQDQTGLRQNDSFLSEEFLSSDEGSSSEDSTSLDRGNWDSPVEFLLSCLSFAVGLGNIWRFPYLCYRNGGGAFLIPYVISLVLMGLPVFLFEMGAGQFSAEGPVSVWKLCPLFQGIGYGMCFLSLYIGTYYNIILSWAFFYIFSSFTSSLPWASCENPTASSSFFWSVQPPFPDTWTESLSPSLQSGRSYSRSMCGPTPASRSFSPSASPGAA